MKKLKGSETPAFAHPLEFTLLEDAYNDEDTDASRGWFTGTVRIVSCPREPSLNGLVVKARICGRLPCRVPYWIYCCRKGIRLNLDAVLKGRPVDNVMIIPEEASVCIPTRLKPQLDAADLEYLLGECAPSFTLGSVQTDLVRRWLTKMAPPQLVPSAWASWQLRFPWIAEHSHLARAPFVATVFDALLHFYTGRDAQKQRKRLDDLPLEKLRDLASDCQKHPWELLWTRTMRTQYGGLKGLRMLPEDCPMNRIPLLEQTAVRFLNLLRFSQSEKNTIFGAELFHGCIPCLPQDFRTTRFEPQLLDYLKQRDVVFCGPTASFGDPLAMHADHRHAQLVIRHLERIRTDATAANQIPLRLRARDQVPCIPPRLTGDQMTIGRHVVNHWLTIVLGSPGTGKTSVLTWILSHYRCALSTGFVGRLVKMLHRRNGRRPEMAYTIDSLIYAVLKSPASGDAARQWLASFEVLVIDECSNVSMGHMAKLLMLFPNLRKLVLVGDPNQLPALKPGDFLADMLTHFPHHTHRLRENLRVASGLAALQEAPSHILNGRPELIQWTPTGPISVVSYTGGAGTTRETLYQLYSSILRTGGERARSLLNVQLLALTHQGAFGRIALNEAFHSVAESLGILRPPANRRERITIHPKLRDVYSGCKLTCLQNYNHPIEKEFGPGGQVRCISDPVANGEIFIVHRIWRPRAPARGICLEVYDTSAEEATKLLWIDDTEGISPFDLDWGYTTTVYKSQGGEFPWVVFCVPPSPAEHWTRANAYVAVSRAQQSFTVMGKVEDFNAIARRPDQVRRTVFGHLLAQQTELKTHAPLSNVPAAEQAIVADPEHECQLLPADKLAVPTLKEFMPQPKE